MKAEEINNLIVWVSAIVYILFAFRDEDVTVSLWSD